MDLLVPQMSSPMETARVIRWLKKPGDSVRMGEPLVEMETDKSTIEIESPADGVLLEVLVQDGEDVLVGGSLGRLRTPDGAPEPAATGASSAPIAPIPAESKMPLKTEVRSAAVDERIKASPLARRLAGEARIDLKTIRGTGPNARIRKRDLVRAMPSYDRQSATPTGVGSSSAVRPLSTMRARIAETVSASRKTIPSFNLDRWVETTQLAAARAGIAAARTGEKITVTDMLLQAVADTLAKMPSMLDRWFEGAPHPSVTASGTVDIGLVVALENGLLIPTLSDMANKGLTHIARIRRQAAERARAGRLSAADLAPTSITLSNLGNSGADRFEAIINPGQSSILAVGREHERALASGGKLYAASGVNLTLSVDHRLIDGKLGADFLGLLAERIEHGSWRSD
jgi:pyruvate dehydrogenase E2 component (dihydrolipoyllysine-residue acetyltransferase)